MPTSRTRSRTGLRATGRIPTLTKGLVAALAATFMSAMALPAAATAVPSGERSPLMQAAAEAPGQDRKLLLMLDVSGSMKEPDASGVTKMVAAKAALASVIDSLPPSTQVGLRVYGATVIGGKPTPAACADSQLAVPVGPLDRDKLVSSLDRFVPRGETPIAFSLSQALEDLGQDGQRDIVMLSDGKESCSGDPCPAIRKLMGAGINLRLDTVGVAADAQARAQLMCLADAGHGSYYDIEETDELISAMQGRMAPPSPAALPTPSAPAAPVVAEPQGPGPWRWIVMGAAATGLAGVALLLGLTKS